MLVRGKGKVFVHLVRAVVPMAREGHNSPSPTARAACRTRSEARTRTHKYLQRRGAQGSVQPDQKSLGRGLVWRGCFYLVAGRSVNETFGGATRLAALGRPTPRPLEISTDSSNPTPPAPVRSPVHRGATIRHHSGRALHRVALAPPGKCLSTLPMPSTSVKPERHSHRLIPNAQLHSSAMYRMQPSVQVLEP